ncbi:MAG: hypothetical protein V3T23_13610, partial [Nitrososphaerales archaeon]
AGVPFFFKQWGGIHKSQAGRELDGKTYDEFPSRVKLPALKTGKRLAALVKVTSSYPWIYIENEQWLFSNEEKNSSAMSK